MRTFLWAVAFALLMLPTTARAAGSQTADYGKFYVGIGGGAVIPQSTSVSISGAVTGSGNVNYKSDAAIMGMAGYHLSNYVTGEAELGYSSVAYDNISGTLTAGSLGTGSGTIGVRGHASALVGLFNAIVTPLGVKGVSPYIGGGLGFADTDSKVKSLTFGSSTATVNSSHSETDLALDAMAGANVSLNDNVALGGRYQYVWINSSSSASGGGVTGKSGNFGAHVITAQATYSFQ